MSGIGHNSVGAPGNWIALSRDMVKHWLVGFGQSVKPADEKRGAYSRAEAWIDLIMLARYAPGTEKNKGRKVDLETGQLQGGYAFLAERWNWSVKQVRGFLEKLLTEEMIARNPQVTAEDGIEDQPKKGKQSGNQIQILTICNYRKYQVAVELEGMLEGQARGKRGASEGQHLNKETIEEGTNVPLSPDQLSLVPSDPPKRKGSEVAKEAFALWNETAARCDLSQATRLTPKRAVALVNRVKDAEGMDGFRKALANVEKSAFLQGRNDRGWKADLDWLIQPSSFTRLLEGGYGNGAHAGTGKSSYSGNGTYTGRLL